MLIHSCVERQTMKSCIKLVFLYSVIVGSILLSAAQELSKRKCDEYSRKIDAIPEPNEYRKYMDKFVIAKTLFKEYDAVLISEEYALTSVAASNALQFIAVVIDNQPVDVLKQEQQDGIYLIKLRYNVELYRKIVCLWNREDIPDGYNFFTVVHETGIKSVPFLRTYLPYVNNCPIVQPESDRNRHNFCLQYENGRQTETALENPSASSLIFLKSFQNVGGLNKNHYIMGVLKRADDIYGRKLWPNLRWIENIVWKGLSGNIEPPPMETDCGRVVVADANKQLISFSRPTYRGEFPWQAALFEVKDQTEIYLCGGSLLNRDTVLTAAHCVTNSAGEISQPARFIVKLGLFNLDGTESMPQIVSVFQFIPHELYNVTSYDSDIAIIKLKSLVTIDSFVRPICLIDNTRSFHLNEGVVAGWGYNERNEQPNNQRKGTLLIPTARDCRQQGADFIRELLNEANYCAANKNGENVCYGDSGSGMTAEIGGRWYVRGLVSYGGVTNGLCNPEVFSLFTNTTYFYDWIVSKM